MQTSHDATVQFDVDQPPIGGGWISGEVGKGTSCAVGIRECGRCCLRRELLECF